MKLFLKFFCALLFIISAITLTQAQTAAGTGGNNNGEIKSKGSAISSWITGNGLLLQKQAAFTFGKKANNYINIDIDATQKFQTVDGFGYTLTGGSAVLINQMKAADKAALLQEIFSPVSETGIKISYLRLSIGASDLDATVFSYDDMPPGQTDEPLTHFNLDADKTHLIPLLKEILALHPAIKFIATPWSAPTWMKTNNSSVGGSLKPEYYAAYANYFVKYIQAMQAEGISITAVTPQNEPLHPGNNPSMYMPAEDQATFIKNNLGPAFQIAGLTTKIIVYDHNCNKPEYPLTILNDADASAFVDGSAFHLYEGDISALTQVHNAYPNKNLYFTEQYTASTGEFGGDLKWHLKNVIIGSMRNWSKLAMEWNLANDPNFEPHTPGGCTTCKGALTIGNNTVIRNVAYYIIGHASRFVPAGSVRIASNINGGLNNVVFETPDGKKVLIVENDGSDAVTFNIRFNGMWAATTLAGGSVGTYVW